MCKCEKRLEGGRAKIALLSSTFCSIAFAASGSRSYNLQIMTKTGGGAIISQMPVRAPMKFEHVVITMQREEVWGKLRGLFKSPGPH